MRSYFREMRMDPWAKQIIDGSNSTSTKGKPFVYGHLENGFVGSTYTFVENTPVLTQAEVARFWGYCRHAAHLAQRAIRS